MVKATDLQILGFAGDLLGTSTHQLSRLLGYREAAAFYKAGKTRRISPLHMRRLVYLVALQHIYRVDVAAMDAINWQTGEVTWKPGMKGYAAAIA